MVRKFNRLNIPDHWEQYWSKYPQGYTILEALIDWVGQVDSMVDNVNEWNIYLDDFVEHFDEKLTPTVIDTLYKMEADGTLATIINETIFSDLNTKIDSTIKDVNIFSSGINNNTIELNYTGDTLNSAIEKDSTGIVLQSNLTYGADGELQTVTETYEGQTVTYTLNYTEGVITSVTKEVI